jgi:hypothetical protein
VARSPWGGCAHQAGRAGTAGRRFEGRPHRRRGRLARQVVALGALVAWLDRLASYGRAKSGFTTVLANTATHDRLAQQSYEPIVGALGSLLLANEAAGTIRPGVDPDDVLLALGFLWRVSPDDAGAAKAARLVELILDGLRVGASAGTAGWGAPQGR